jgi:ankyrin repeat protein
MARMPLKGGIRPYVMDGEVSSSESNSSSSFYPFFLCDQLQRNMMLYNACMLGNFESAKNLLDEGADFDLRVQVNISSLYSMPHLEFPRQFGNSLLHAACTKNQTALVSMLLDRGAEINLKNVVSLSSFNFFQ